MTAVCVCLHIHTFMTSEATLGQMGFADSVAKEPYTDAGGDYTKVLHQTNCELWCKILSRIMFGVKPRF